VRTTWPIVCLAICLMCPVVATAQLRIVNYNTAKRSNAELGIIFEAMRDEEVNGNARMPDVFVFQEQTVTSINNILGILDATFGAILYEPQSSPLGGYPGGDVALAYRADTIQVLEEVAIATGGPRPTMRYKLRPVGYDTNADFYIYGSHLKASTGSYNESVREEEVEVIRANADTLGADAKIIYTGDFNLYDDEEGAFINYTAAGDGQAFDPVNQAGNWHDNATYKLVHTQSPLKNRSGALAGGGVDDRFDFQLLSANVVDAEGVSYAAGTYRTFGNDGSHTFNEAINTGSWSPPGVSDPSAVLDALVSATDHLPVAVDYQLPATLSVSLNTTPVIVGAPANSAVNVLVANGTPTGGDELDHSGSGSDGLSGAFSGIETAGGTGTFYALTAATGVAGSFTGTVTVVASSPETPNATNTQDITYTVLNHSEGSFSGGSNQDSLTVNFGTVSQFSGINTLEFTVHNVGGAAAGLDVVSFSGTGDTGTLSPSIVTPFSSVPAEGNATFMAMLDTTSAGSFSATYTLEVTDENLSGTTAGTDLTLTLNGTVSAATQKLTANPALISTNVNQGQTTAGTFVLSNSVASSLNWTLSEPASWLSVAPTNGSLGQGGNETISFTLNATGLTPGQYDTSITVSAAGAQAITVPVVFVVEHGNTVIPTPATLQATLTEGQSTNMTFSVLNEGDENINLSLTHDATIPDNWLHISPSLTPLGAGLSKEIVVTIDAASLLPDTYSATISLTPDSGNYGPNSLAVNLTVNTAPPPEISVSPTTLTASCQSGLFTTMNFDISNVAGTNSLDLTFSLGDDATNPVDWVSTSLSGAGIEAGDSMTVTVTFDATSLTVGVYNATLYIASDDPVTPNVDVPMTFTVTAASEVNLVISPEIIEHHMLVETSKTVSCGLTLNNSGSKNLNSFYYELVNAGGDYDVKTSDDPGGPSYVWNDISGTGTALPKPFFNPTIPLGFDFPYYGRAVTSLTLSADAMLLATNDAYRDFSYPYWEAIAPGEAYYKSDAGTVYYEQTDSETMVVQLSDFELNGDPSKGLTVQMVLKKNGDIYFYYNDVNDIRGDIRSYINEKNNLKTFMASENQTNILHDGMAVLFKANPVWFAAMDHFTLTIYKNQSRCSDLTFNSVGVAPGTYHDIFRTEYRVWEVDHYVDEERAARVVLHVHETPYDMWAAQHFEEDEIDGGISERVNDADGDGIPNGQEYITGTDPRDPNNGGIPLADLTLNIHDDLKFSWRQQSGGTGTEGVDYVWKDASIHLALKTNLLDVTWTVATTSDVNTVSAVSNGDGTDNVTVQLSGPMADQQQAYGSLCIDFE